MTALHGPCSLDVAAQVDPILRRAIYWGPSSGAADSRISRIAANTLSVSIGAGFTETVRFYASGIDIGFFGFAMGQSIGSPDTFLHRGLSGGVECDSSGGLGAYGFFMAAQFGSFQKYADSAPQAVLYKAQDAYDIATGANRTGADVRVAAGIGQWVVTVVNFAALAGKTLTYIENGVTVVLTEGVNWTAATSNAATATSLRAAMVASGSMVADANTLGAGIIGASGVESTWSLSITSNDAVNLTVSQPTGNGTVRLGLANDGTTFLALTSTSGLFTVPAIGPVFVSAQAASPVTVANADSGKEFTNEGAAGLITFNLPTAVANLVYDFIVQDADGIKIVASGGDTIRLAANVSAAAGNAQSTTIGSTVRLVAINATEWIATSIVGTWTVT